MEEETTATTETDDPAPIIIIEDETQSTTIHLDGVTELTIKNEATLGDLLVSSLLMLLIVSFITKWVYSAIWGRDTGV